MCRKSHFFTNSFISQNLSMNHCSCGGNASFAEKSDPSEAIFIYFIVSRSHLGPTEVESSAARSLEKLTNLVTAKFSRSCHALLITILEMIILKKNHDNRFVSVSSVINLLSCCLCLLAPVLQCA